jgi:hypothetical protein
LDLRLAFGWAALPCCETAAPISLLIISCFLVAALILAVFLPIWFVTQSTISTTAGIYRKI